MTETIRRATDADGEAIGSLIAGIFAEYDGVLFLRDELPKLAGIASYYERGGGAGFVAERGSLLIGCAGYTTSKSGAGIELKKLYVRATERNTGLGGRLVALVEEAAARAGARYIDLWSDTKFLTAHAFYERRGYVKSGETRPLHDASHTIEFYFKKPLVDAAREPRG